MNIQEAFTKAKAGGFIARGSEASFSNAIFYIPDFQINQAISENIPHGETLIFAKVPGGYYTRETRSDGYFWLKEYTPSEADILATDWIEFQV